MLEALSKGSFERDVGRLEARLLTQRGWTVMTAAYPVLDVIFAHPRRASFRLRFTCDDWDDFPPSIDLLRADGEYIPAQRQPDDPHEYVFANSGSVFNSGTHERTGRPFVCMRGSREFHTHSGHRGEAWDNYRGQPGNDLLGLLDQLWRVWVRAAR